VALLLAAIGCTSLPTPRVLPAGDGVVRRHALIFTASDWREGESDYTDPEGRNAGWIQTVRIYNALRAQGFSAERVHVLYLDGTPHDDEPAVDGSGVSAAFRHGLGGEATLRRLRQRLRLITATMDADDHVVLHLGLHGRRSGRLLADSGETIRGRDLRRLLAPVPAANRLVVLDACHAEAVLARIELPGPFIGTAKADDYGWVDRDFSFGQFFFRCADLMPAESGQTALNHRAALAKAAAGYKAAGEAKRDYILTAYEGIGLPPEEAARLTFEPVLVSDE
jgi:hypothetical protein